MKLSAILPISIVLIPLAAFGQKKEVLEMQRDMLQMQDQIRTMNDKLTRIETLVGQMLDESKRANSAVSTLQGSLTERMSEQTKSMLSPVAGVGPKVDQMTEEFRAVRENVSDMTSRLGRLESKINDLDQTVRTIQAPPVAPPPDGWRAFAGGCSPLRRRFRQNRPIRRRSPTIRRETSTLPCRSSRNTSRISAARTMPQRPVLHRRDLSPEGRPGACSSGL